MPGVVQGDLEIHCISAGLYRWDGGAFFGVVPKTMWSRKTDSDSLNRIPVSFNCYLIRTGDHQILIETGAGDKLEPRMRERMDLPAAYDSLPDILSRQGFDPDSIDIVINSHLHFDHCGGNTVLSPTGPLPAFPRARYFASRAEWEHAHRRHPRDSVSYNDANYDPLVKSGRMELVDEGREVAPGIRMRPVPGHNGDMCVVTASSGGRTFCFWSDLIPTAAHVQPTWVASFDLFPLETIDNKARWLAIAERDGWLCGFGHDPHHAFVRIRRDPKTHFAVESVADSGA